MITPVVGARRHRRLLPHRDRRPHRAVGQLHRAADRRAARAVRRQQRAVLHQCDRHADQRRRRDGQLPDARSTTAATCSCAPATTTRGRGSSASIATPPQLAGFASVLFDRIEQRRIECGQPRDSLRLGGDWRRRRVRREPRTSPGTASSAASPSNPADDQEYRPEVADRRRGVVSDRGLYAGRRACRTVRRVPGPQHDRQLVQRHPDVSEPVAVRHERPDALRATWVELLRS